MPAAHLLPEGENLLDTLYTATSLFNEWILNIQQQKHLMKRACMYVYTVFTQYSYIPGGMSDNQPTVSALDFLILMFFRKEKVNLYTVTKSL